MTERLYYSNSSLTEFEATVVEATTTEDGRHAVLLDRTAFYPTSGGQPFDTGLLGDARVIDVVDREDGAILHVVDRPLSVGAGVRGHVDWVRRFDHMQQHTGQHVLSAAFDRVAGVPTVSFHLGESSSTIDLAREISARDVEGAEDEANRVVWADRPVTIRFADAEEVARLPLRKASSARRHVAAGRGDRRRSLGLRRHPRGQHWRHRHHRDRVHRALPGRNTGRVRVRRPRAACASLSPGPCRREREGAVRGARLSFRPPSRDCRPKAGTHGVSRRNFSPGSPSTRRRHS